MKSYNENILNDLLHYVKTYQYENGISPSYRNIMKHFNFSSLSLVSRYLKILYDRGLLEKSNIGKIGISKNIEKSSTILAPIVGTVTCGSPIYAQENIEGMYQLPVDIFGSDKQFILHAQGDSMIEAGIQDGDLLVVKQTTTADNGKIVVALLDDSATVKRFFKKKNEIILHPENKNYKDIVTKDVKILGIVEHCIHKF